MGYQHWVCSECVPKSYTSNALEQPPLRKLRYSKNTRLDYRSQPFWNILDESSWHRWVVCGYSLLFCVRNILFSYHELVRQREARVIYMDTILFLCISGRTGIRWFSSTLPKRSCLWFFAMQPMMKFRQYGQVGLFTVPKGHRPIFILFVRIGPGMIMLSLLFFLSVHWPFTAQET